MSAAEDIGNARLLDVAKALYETRFPHTFTMQHYATRSGDPCDALANYAYRDDLQDLLGIEGHSLIYVSGEHAGEFVHWGDEVILQWFHVSLREAEACFSSLGSNGAAETPDAAGDFIKKLVAQRSGVEV